MEKPIEHKKDAGTDKYANLPSTITQDFFIEVNEIKTVQKFGHFSFNLHFNPFFLY